jgi:hydroxymethylpyrimidine/phosphomethylpyrimidine kinase
MSTHPFPIVLSFAATDPSGGAGLQADILTLASLGCHPLSVVTGITVQDSAGVDDLLPMEADWVIDQARMILEDMPVAAFKIGLIGSTDNVVLASGAGDEFATEELIVAMRELLIPHTMIITPNSIEARRLVDDDDEEPSLDECARRIRALGCEYVLITGTHENTSQVINTLYNRGGKVRSDSWQRLPGSYHGSGCTLASAIAGLLAGGMEMADAVKEAQEYTWQTLKAGFRPGMGQFIPDRLFWARNEDNETSQN